MSLKYRRLDCRDYFSSVVQYWGVSVIFLSGPIGAGKTAVAKALLPLLPAPLSYVEGDTFWSFIRKDEERSLRDNFPVLVCSMTAAALPFARSGFRVLIDFSIPPTYVDTARKLLKEVPFDFVLLRPSFAVCAERAASRPEGAIRDYVRLKNFYARFEEGPVEPICDDDANPEWPAESPTCSTRDVFVCFEDFTSTAATAVCAVHWATSEEIYQQKKISGANLPDQSEATI